MSLHKTYSRAVAQQTGYLATWFPHIELRLGAIGKIEDGQFTQLTSLGNLKIAFDELIDSNPAGSFDVSTESLRSIETKLAGELDDRFANVAEANAGIKVSFAGKNGAVVRTKQVRSRRIDDIAAIEQRMLELVRPAAGARPVWDPDWIVVVEVVSAGVATVVATADRDGSVEIEATAALGPDGLVDADAGLVVKSGSKAQATMLAKKNATPFYKARRIRRKWLWLWGLEVAPADFAPPSDADDLFEDFEVDDEAVPAD